MKLLTHNMLTSNIIKSVTKGFPLIIEVIYIDIFVFYCFLVIVISFRGVCFWFPKAEARNIKALNLKVWSSSMP